MKNCVLGKLRLTVQFCWPEAKNTKGRNTFKTENEKMPGPE